MLQLPILSLFIRLIPESFLLMYAICVLTNSEVNFKKLFVTGILGGMGVYVTRLMPIHFGVHTILGVILHILLAIQLNKIDVYKAIAGALVATVICSISDLILVVIYTNVLQDSSEIVTGQTLFSVIASVPSFVIFYLILNIIVCFKKKRAIYEKH